MICAPGLPVTAMATVEPPEAEFVMEAVDGPFVPEASPVSSFFFRPILRRRPLP